MAEEKRDKKKKEDIEEMDSLSEGLNENDDSKENFPEEEDKDKEILSSKKGGDFEEGAEISEKIREDKFEEELFEASEEIPSEKEKPTEDIIDQELFALEEEITPFEEEESLETLEEIKPEVTVKEIIKKKEITVPLKKRKRYLEKIVAQLKIIHKNKALMRIIYLSICIAMIVAISFHMINRYIQVRSYLYKGILAIEKKDFKSAEENLKKSLKYTYDRVKIYHKFAQSYAPVDPQKAISLLETALKEKPQNLILLKSLLIIYGDMNNLEKAIEVYNKIMDIDPKNVAAIVSLGWIYFSQRDIEKASIECEKALNIKYNHIESLFLLQNILMEKKMYNAAVGVYRFIYKITDEKQCDPNILFKLGEHYLKKNRKKLAEELFRITVKHDPNRLGAHYYLGTFFYEKGMINRSAAEFQFVINKNPKHADAHNYLGLIFYEKNMMKEAFVRFNDCLQLNPLHEKAIYNMANVYYYINDLKKCIEFYSKAHELGIDTPLMHYNIGIAYYHHKMYENALQEWEKLLPKESNNPIVNFNLGTVNLRLNRLDEAKEELNKSLKIFWKILRKARKEDTPEEEQEIYYNMSKAYNNQGIIYELLNRKREAMSLYSQSIEFASWAKKKNKVAYDNLQRLLHGIPAINLDANINNDLSKVYTRKEIKKKPNYWERITASDVNSYTICVLIALFVFGSYKLLIKKKSIFDLIYEFYRKSAKIM